MSKAQNPLIACKLSLGWDVTKGQWTLVTSADRLLATERRAGFCGIPGLQKRETWGTRQVMIRNTDGLKRNARSRSEDAMRRTTAAILLMLSEETEINFRSVATRAKVSTAWLYGTKAVRDKIVKIRNTSPVSAGENLQHRQRLSHERVVATLRIRILTLEVINRELKEQLEAAYGRLAVVQPKLGSLHQTSE
ncbi:MAG: DUF6262 family protein [Edaphobacter sp.]